MKIGVITDCMKKQSLDEALAEAEKLKVDGVQIYATNGAFSPDGLTEDSKAHYRKLLVGHGLEISALCGDLGGYGFEIEKDNAERIEKTKRIIDLAVQFNTKVVTTHIGVIPSLTTDPRYGIMLRALTECGLYAKRRNVTLAIETGPEKAEVLKRFLEDTKGGVGVNLDPANFTMVTGQDAVEAVYMLRDYIVHTHLKDGRMLDKNIDPAAVYHAFAVGGVEALNACKGFAELPIGEGDVDWKAYLAALSDIGYDGYLTVEREAGDDPFEDISAGIGFIRELLKNK